MKKSKIKNLFCLYFLISLVLVLSLFLNKTPNAHAGDSKTITVTFGSTPSHASASKAILKYNKDFAFSYSFDDGLDDGYDPGFKYMNGGYSTYLGKYFGGLYFTDGAGNNVPFRGGYALYSRNLSYSDLHVNTPSYLKWAQLQESLDNGWDIFNHGYTSSSVSDPDYVYYNGDPGGHESGPLDYVYELSQLNVDISSHISLKNDAGEVIKPFETSQVVLPNGDTKYVQPSFDNNFNAIYSQGESYTFDGETIPIPKYIKANDSISNNRFVMRRWFDYETKYLDGGELPGQLFSNVDTLASNSTGSNKYWGQEFTHQITTSTYPLDYSGGMTWSSWKSLMDHIENTYGRFGSDNAWVAGAEEVYDYMMVKQNTTLTQSLVGNQLIIDLDVSNIPSDLKHYALSLLVDSDAEITNISYSSDINYHTDNKDTGLINLDWGDNSYHDNDITRVESLVSNAESVKSLSSINNARTYVDLLSSTQQAEEKTAFNARLDAIVIPLRTWYIKIKGDFATAANANTFTSTSVSYSPSTYNWNNFGVVKDNTITPAGNDLINMKDSDGLTSTLSLSNTASFKHGGLLSASTGNNSGLYPDGVISSNAQIYSSAESQAKIKIYGLNNHKNYDIKLFGYTSATGNTGDKATTLYTIGGATKELYVRENTSQSVLFSDVSPTNGEIEIAIVPKNTAWGYGLLNAMEIVENLLPAPTDLSYETPNIYTKDSSITPISPTVTGDEIVYSVSPDLPAGLSLDPDTGVISGTPTEVTSLSTYTVTATNAGGSDSFGVLISVKDIAPSDLSYESVNIFNLGEEIESLAPSVTGTPVVYSVSPDLPAGLSIDESTGIISGTPTEVIDSNDYTVIASNTGGDTSFNVNIKVDYKDKNSPVASPSSGTYNQSQSITLTATDGDYIKYSTVSVIENCSSGTLYSAPITISASSALYTRACDSFGNFSDASFNYIIAKSESKKKISSGSSVLSKSNYPNPNLNSNLNTNNNLISNNQNILNNNIDNKVSEIQKINKDLKFGMFDDDVKTLQLFLIKQNKGPKARELIRYKGTTYFGKLTRSALSEWQKAEKISPSAGYFGSITRAKIKLLNL